MLRTMVFKVHNTRPDTAAHNMPLMAGGKFSMRRSPWRRATRIWRRKDRRDERRLICTQS